MPTESQPRLALGPHQLVLAEMPGVRGERWALPGGGAATYAELSSLAAARGWPRPELIRVTVQRRPDDRTGRYPHNQVAILAALHAHGRLDRSMLRVRSGLENPQFKNALSALRVCGKIRRTASGMIEIVSCRGEPSVRQP